ncbi:MAG: hypothetical protein IJV06_10230 [Bacteroidaceae bacterium]|nr:hypothetical protein [Bacteroidaceae bacterium]
MRLLLFNILLLCSVLLSAAEPLVLTQAMIDKAGGQLTVSSDYTLKGETIVLPQKFRLVFKGGTMAGGVLQGNQSVIKAEADKQIFGPGLQIKGTWNIANIYDTWFIFDERKTFVSNQIITNILALASDNVKNHIYFRAGRTYYFELPYKGRGDFGEMFSYKMVDGKKKVNYGEVYDDKYSYLRIFTIPSNTHVTIDCTLQMLPTNIGAYFVFWEKDKRNVTVDGSGRVSADNSVHVFDNPYRGKNYYGEWGFIFNCIRCKNFTFRDITLTDAFGDCLIFRGSYSKGDTSPRYAEGLTMENVKILRARRNGLTVAARNCTIRDCRFEKCGKVNGTLPKSAVDFEADNLQDYPELENRDVLLDNCVFVDNVRDIASSNNATLEYGQPATVISNCVFSNPLKICWAYWLKFDNCTITSLIGPNGAEISGGNWVKNVSFSNCNIKSMPRILQTKSWNNKFINCKIENLK